MSVSVNDIGTSIPAVLLQGADGTLFAVDGKAVTTEVAPQATTPAGIFYTYAATGAQKGATSTAENFYAQKVTVPAGTHEVYDCIEYEGIVFVDGSNSTPQLTVKFYLGALVLDSGVISTAAANDYVVLKGSARLMSKIDGTSSTWDVLKGEGCVKDATVTEAAHVFTAGETGPDLSAAADVRVSVQFNASHADNKARLHNLTYTFKRSA